MKTQVTENQTICFYRVSTDRQDNERQFADVRKYCAAYGYNVVQEFEETISGAAELSERKELQNLLKFAELNKPQYCVVSELSRLGRSNLTLQIIETFNKLGICFISLKEGLKTLNADGTPNPTTQLIIDILNGINKFELQTIRYRVKSGLQKVVNAGHWVGQAPFGYKVVNKQLVIREDEALIAKQMFEQYAAGWGTVKIASNLNRGKVSTRQDKIWRDTSILKILSNSLYAGKRVWKDQEIDTPETRIIDDITFAAVKEKIDGRINVNPINKHYKNDYMLQNKIRCACGEHFIGRMRDNIYMCRTKKYAGGCQIKSININFLEGQVKKHLIENCLDQLKDTRKVTERTNELKAELAILEEQLKKEQTHQNYLINVIDRIGQAKFETKYDASKEAEKKLQEQLDTINVTLSRTTDDSWIEEAVAGLDIPKMKLNVDNKNAHKIPIKKDVVQKLVDNIAIDNEAATVTLIDGSTFTIERKQRKTA